MCLNTCKLFERFYYMFKNGLLNAYCTYVQKLLSF